MKKIHKADEPPALQNYRISHPDGRWPSFFSALRDYLGDAAERQLALLGEL